jgi:hypothetical protein
LPYRTPPVAVSYVILLLSAAALLAQPQSRPNEPGLSGSVVGPDGAPVSGGRVTIIRGPGRGSAAIDRAGRFHVIPDAIGPHEVLVSASGLAPHRFNINVPASRTVNLPEIRLAPATYYRVRFVTAAGEPITGPVRRRSVDAEGLTIPDSLDGSAADQIDRDGTMTIGPLPRGITLMALDVPPFAQTRIPDLTVTGKETMIDGGVITIQPGAMLHADIVDETGVPVPLHDVWIEDAVPQSLLSFRPVKTNAQGRATFDRLAPGRYRLWTRTKERCGAQPLPFSRVVTVGGSGEVRARLIAGGSARFRVVTPLGPFAGRRLSASPASSATPAPWQPSFTSLSGSVRRPPAFVPAAPSCGGMTDEEGRVTLPAFPPGAANIQVGLFNSTYMKRVIVPEGGREVEILIPDGFVSVHAGDQRTNQPVAKAKMVWTGNGARVEATANGNGDALLDAVGAAGGQLAVTAAGYEPREADFPEAPATTQEVLLPPAAGTRLEARVVNASGEAVANVVVELLPAGPLDISDFSVTNARGVVTFVDVPARTPRLTAHAEGVTVIIQSR